MAEEEIPKASAESGTFGATALDAIASITVIRDNTSSAGRDHGPSGFSLWMAGGGVKGGVVHGATDDLGHKAVENRVSVHDFHATMLHLLGMNYRNLVYQRHGLNERLTDQFPASVISEILV